MRKANEKLLSYQVENRKLLDRCHVLQLQVEDMRIHKDRLKMQAENYQSQVSALRVKKAASTSQQRKPSANLSGPERATGTYLNTSVGDVQSANYSNEMRDEMLAEQADLCRRVDAFFVAMKQLQRAVNKKEDITDLKGDFETKQRALQKLNK